MNIRQRNSFLTPAFISHVFPALVYAVLLFVLGSIHTAVEIPENFVARDKLGHFLAFGGLTLLVLRAFRFELASASLRQVVLLAIAVSSSVGAMLEVWQLMFPYRSAEFLDWVADTLGAILAGCVGYAWSSWRGRHVAMSAPHSRLP